MSLSQSILEYPIPTKTRSEIARQLWGSDSSPMQHPAPYFQYYTEQCQIFFQSHKAGLPVKTHDDIVQIASDIIDNHTYSEVKQRLQERCGANDDDREDALKACVDLAVRLLIMLDVGELPNAFSGRRKLVWSEGSIREFLHGVFPDKPVLDHGGVKLARGFDISSMVRIAGFRVELTTNLADHLRLRDADKTVTVFHHASFLMRERKMSTALFPDGLIVETLATLSLLFPQGDRACKKWYKKQEEPEELDLNVLKCGSPPRRIDEYTYWHDRLVILKEAFDESRPSTLAQWWNDRREGTQWYTLWVVVSLTLLFGLVQSIEGAMQVYKAYHP